MTTTKPLLFNFTNTLAGGQTLPKIGASQAGGAAKPTSSISFTFNAKPTTTTPTTTTTTTVVPPINISTPTVNAPVPAPVVAINANTPAPPVPAPPGAPPVPNPPAPAPSPAPPNPPGPPVVVVPTKVAPTLAPQVVSNLLESQTLGDILDHWKREVEMQRTVFTERAKKVVEWDTELRKTRLDLLNLNLEVKDLASDTKAVEDALTEVSEQQTRMENTLNQVEKFMDGVLAESGGMSMMTSSSSSSSSGRYANTAQAARAEAYQRALEIDTLLDKYSSELQGVTDAVASELRAQADDPLGKVKQMLNQEMQALNEVERKSAEILQKARELSSLGNRLRR